MRQGAGIVEITLVVACALVDADGQILLQQRPAGKPMAGLWEFPGGKVEQGETPEVALVREIGEELGVIVQAPYAAAFASEPLADKHLLLLLYICREWTGTLTPIESQRLRWTTVDDMRQLAMPPADAPLIDILERLLQAPSR